MIVWFAKEDAQHLVVGLGQIIMAHVVSQMRVNGFSQSRRKMDAEQVWICNKCRTGFTSKNSNTPQRDAESCCVSVDLCRNKVNHLSQLLILIIALAWGVPPVVYVFYMLINISTIKPLWIFILPTIILTIAGFVYGHLVEYKDRLRKLSER